MAALTVTYHDIEITYREWENDWSFVLRGRERTAPSLKEAKETIDRPAPKKGKPFQKFEAWHVDHGTVETVTVLFIAGGAHWRGGPQVRVRFSKQDERNVEAASVYPKTDHNDKLVSLVQELNDAIEKAEADIEEAIGRMKCYQVVADEAGGPGGAGAGG
jgi:hypothetical protein